MIYVNTIDNRANFFGASNIYEQELGIGAGWYAGAEKVSRAPVTGLGADGSASYLNFATGWFLAPVYDWRKAAGDALITSGFHNFKNLYNKVATDPVGWDTKQLKDEQAILQPIHEKYLGGSSAFQRIADIMTGVDVLDYRSRVEFGCKLLGHSESQGCKS